MYVSYDTDFLLKAPAIKVPNSRLSRQRIEPMVRLPEGQHLFYQGDEGDSVYRVTKGVLRLSRVTRKGRQQVIAFGYPGDIVGFPVAGKRNTDCDALTDAELQVLPARLPADCGLEAANVAYLAVAALFEIGNMQEHFMTLGRKSSREKVASFLRALMRRAGDEAAAGIRFELPMSRADIAEFLGLRTETVSRAFTELRQIGAITLDGAQIVTVVDPEMLDDLAEGD